MSERTKRRGASSRSSEGGSSLRAKDISAAHRMNENDALRIRGERCVREGARGGGVRRKRRVRRRVRGPGFGRTANVSGAVNTECTSNGAEWALVVEAKTGEEYTAEVSRRRRHGSGRVRRDAAMRSKLRKLQAVWDAVRMVRISFAHQALELLQVGVFRSGGKLADGVGEVVDVVLVRVDRNAKSVRPKHIGTAE